MYSSMLKSSDQDCRALEMKISNSLTLRVSHRICGGGGTVTKWFLKPSTTKDERLLDTHSGR